MSFDRDCSAGVFIQQLRHWIPTPNMLAFNRTYQGQAAKARRYLGWMPIVVWRGRSYSRRNTYGILRQRANGQINSNWQALKQFALRAEALDGRTMQGILLSSRFLNAALRVEPPTEDGFVYHIKYKTSRGHGIYMQRDVNLRERFVFHELIYAKIGRAHV